MAREATKRGMSVGRLLDAEVTANIGLVTEQEIDSFYKANKPRLQGEESEVREKIRAHLQNQKLAIQRERSYAHSAPEPRSQST